jgi:hypothetical protein
MCGSYSEGDEWEDEVEEYLDDLEITKIEDEMYMAEDFSDDIE